MKYAPLIYAGAFVAAIGVGVYILKQVADEEPPEEKDVDRGTDWDRRPMQTSDDRVDGQILSLEPEGADTGLRVWSAQVGLSVPPGLPSQNVLGIFRIQLGPFPGAGMTLAETSIRRFVEAGSWKVVELSNLKTAPVGFFNAELEINGQIVSVYS